MTPSRVTNVDSMSLRGMVVPFAGRRGRWRLDAAGRANSSPRSSLEQLRRLQPRGLEALALRGLRGELALQLAQARVVRRAGGHRLVQLGLARADAVQRLLQALD